MTDNKINIVWFRRDLRLQDHAALYHALKADELVLPIFIFDTAIIAELPTDDARISFIYAELQKMNASLVAIGSAMRIYHGNVEEIFDLILKDYDVRGLYFNEDYEPYAIQRDNAVIHKFEQNNISIHTYKDQVIFAKNDILKDDGNPYTVYTPYLKKWRSQFNEMKVEPHQITLDAKKFLPLKKNSFPALSDLGFEKSNIKVSDYNIAGTRIEKYKETRDFPELESTSLLSPHLRFGTVGIREIVDKVSKMNIPNNTFLNELIWREFFMQILYHFPHTQTTSFKEKYDAIIWRNDRDEFKKWCEGKTGYLMVDAGMQELNETGYMHNRVRMVVASFLCKHLLIDWRWGEAYFAEKLLDYEASSNIGNWQWAAGCGCDAAPYFRVFNPHIQLKKFDPNFIYVKKWLKCDVEMRNFEVPEIVEHSFARDRALKTYKMALAQE